MGGSITRSVQEIKRDLRSIVTPDLIMRVCLTTEHRWRDRVLGPIQTIYLFMAQILHGNTSCAHVRQLGDFAPFSFRGKSQEQLPGVTIRAYGVM